MRLLLDTQVFLWFIEADPRLSTHAANVIGDPDNGRYLSVASVWEIAIKVKIGKLRLNAPGPLDTVLTQQLTINDVTLLPVEYRHAVRVHAMPYARHANGGDHTDPFDRLIVSQSLVEDLTLVSTDAVLDGYGIVRCW
jgi:PIN domain nuclease of toxin-antitoxin system